MAHRWLWLSVLFVLFGCTTASTHDDGALEREASLTFVWADPIGGQPAPAVTLHIDGVSRSVEARRLPRDVRAELLRLGSVRVAGDVPERMRLVKDQRATRTVSSALATQLIGPRPYVNVLCKFSDVADEPHPSSWYQDLLLQKLDPFWREASYGAMSLAGTTTMGFWVTLPQPKSYYVPSANYVDIRTNDLAQDCAAAAEPWVNYDAFHGINFFFNADMPAFFGFWSQSIVLEGRRVSKPVTWMTKSVGEGVMNHEMGHSFGFQHVGQIDSTTGTTRSDGGSFWDVMSVAYACFTYPPTMAPDPVYGCPNNPPIAANREAVGWLSPTVVSENTTQTITIERLAQPVYGYARMIRIPIRGDSSYYTVEARQRVGYDAGLPGDAVILHKFSPQCLECAGFGYVVDADGNGSTEDEGTMWRTGEVFRDANAGITIRIGAAHATGWTITVESYPPPPPSVNVAWVEPSEATWGPPGTLTAAGFAFNGSGQVYMQWRDATAGWWWSYPSYAPFPSSNGGWSNSVPAPINYCHEYQVVASYAGAVSNTASYVPRAPYCDARTIWIQPQWRAGFGPEGSLVAAGSARGAPGGTPVTFYWRRQGTWWWTAEAYRAPTDANGIWYHAIPNASPWERYDVYVQYEAYASPVCTYSGQNDITWCP